MRPAKRRQMLQAVDETAVKRTGLSEESYQKLKEANGYNELQEVLLEIFEPSKDDDE